MSRYRKIDPRTWNDEKFTAFDPFEKLLWFALLTHPLMTPMGAGLIYPGVLDAIIGNEENWCFRRQETCREHRAETYLEAFQERFLIYRDRSLLIVKNYLIYNLPDNPNQLLSWLSSCEELPRSERFRDLLAHLEAQLEGEPTWLFDGLLRPMAEQQPRGLVARFWDRVGPEKKSGPRPQLRVQNPLRRVSGRVTGNQEQEQEQVQEHTASLPASQPPSQAPGELSPKLIEAVRSMQVDAFQCLVEPTLMNEKFWSAQIEVIEAHDGATLFACLRDVDAYYASRPEEWPKGRPEAARRMKKALEVALNKLLETQQPKERRRKYA
jgi:hypothetical protein